MDMTPKYEAEEIRATFDINRNKEFCELAGICWHEPQFVTWGGITEHKCKKCLKVVHHVGFNIDYKSSPVEVLRVMREREDWPLFAPTIGRRDGSTAEYFIKDNYILDESRPCKLILLANEWMKEGRNVVARKESHGDSEFLDWLADRIVNVYGESFNIDFVCKLRAIAKKIDTA